MYRRFSQDSMRSGDGGGQVRRSGLRMGGRSWDLLFHAEFEIWASMVSG